MRGICHHMSDFPPIRIYIIQWPFFGVFLLDDISQMRRIHNGNLAIKLTNLTMTRAWSALWRLASEDKNSLLHHVLSVPELEEKINKYVYYHSFMNYTVHDGGMVKILEQKPHGVFISSSLVNGGSLFCIHQTRFEQAQDPESGFNVRDMIYSLPHELFQSEDVSGYPVPEGERPRNILAFGNNGDFDPEICFIMDGHHDFLFSICSTYEEAKKENLYPEIEIDDGYCFRSSGSEWIPVQFFNFDNFIMYLAIYNKAHGKYADLSSQYGRDVYLPPYIMFTMQMYGVGTEDIVERGSRVDLHDEGCVNPETGAEYVDEHDILGNNFTCEGRILGKDTRALSALIERMKSVALTK